MTDATQKKASIFSIQSLLFVLLETLLTFIYEHDQKVKALSQPFVRQNMILKVQLLYPQITFFIHFTPRGLLINQVDEQVNEQEQDTPHLTLQLSVWQALQNFVWGDGAQARQLKVTGDEHLAQQFYRLLEHTSIPRIAHDMWQALFDGKPDEKIKPARRRNTRQLLHHIEQQRIQLKQINLQLRETQNDLRQTIKRHKRFKLFAAVGFVLMLGIILWLMYLQFWA